VTLKGLMTEVVVNSDAEAGYEDKVKEKLKVAGLAEVPVRRSSV
jgi:hypothetical protein